LESKQITYHRLTLSGSSREYSVRSGETLAEAIHRLDPAHPLVGCRGGGCGVCRVKILSGDYALGLMSKEYVSDAQQKLGYALACRVYPLSDMEVLYVGRNNI